MNYFLYNQQMLLDNEWLAKRMNELETIKLGENLKKK